MLAMLMLAMFTFTACSSDDDDDNNNGGGSSSNVESLMTTAPSQYGWSGNTENGVLYYRPQSTESDAKLSVLTRVIKTRATDDDDDDDDDDGLDYDAITFTSYNVSGGKVANENGSARACMQFESEAVAKVIYQAIKDGSALDIDDDDDPVYMQAELNALKNKVNISGKTVWYPMDDLKGVDVSNLRECISCWTTGIETGAWEWATSLTSPAFGKLNSDNIYESDLSGTESSYSVIGGAEKATISPVTSSNVITGYRLVLQFKTSALAQKYYNESILDGDDAESHPGISVSGTNVIINEDFGDYPGAATYNKIVIWYDLLLHEPMFLTFVLGD